MKTGSSSKNRQKTSIIESMPLWMRPSGTFGIGFQSVFMLTDAVKIETKSFSDEEFQIIELYSPSSIKGGNILIKKKKTSHSTKPGSKIIFNYKTKAIPDRYSVSTDHVNALRIVHNYDPFTNNSLDIELGRIIDEIFEFSDMSSVPINFILDDTNINTNSEGNSKDNKFKYFDIDNSIELNIYSPSSKGESGRRTHIRAYYKNQNVNHNLAIKFLEFDINIHKNKASDVLTLNRNKIKSEYEDILFDYFLASSFKIITQNFDKIFISDEDKSLGSMFLHYYAYGEKVSTFDIKSFNHWEQFKIKVGEEFKTMKSLLSDSDNITIDYNSITITNPDKIYVLNGNELSINLNHNYSIIKNYNLFFLSKVKEHFKSFSLPTTNFESKGSRKIIIYKNETIFPVGREEYIKVLKTSLYRYGYSARCILPCHEGFPQKIRIKDDAREYYVSEILFYLDTSLRNLHLDYPKMVSPFIRYENEDNEILFKKEVNQKLIDWVFINRYDKNTTKIEIEEAYQQFCEMYSLDEINGKSSS